MATLNVSSVLLRLRCCCTSCVSVDSFDTTSFKEEEGSQVLGAAAWCQQGDELIKAPPAQRLQAGKVETLVSPMSIPTRATQQDNSALWRLDILACMQLVAPVGCLCVHSRCFDHTHCCYCFQEEGVARYRVLAFTPPDIM